MDRLTSAAFRKTYARLREPVEVTANGHVIGTYIPAGAIHPSPVPRPPDPTKQMLSVHEILSRVNKSR